MSTLRIVHHSSKPLIWWNRQRASIDMSPPYQRRGRLWSKSDKAYLVDSIINGYDVPKIYLADFQLGESDLNKKKLPYAIIDGKQRFEAIFDFFDFQLVLNPDFRWRNDPTLRLGGLSLRDLRNIHPNVAEAFETESLDIMSVITDDEKEINELFVRLNRSKPLTGAEIRNAMIGPIPDITREIAHHDFFVDIIRFSTKRAGDYNAAAKILLFEYSDRITGTKKNDLDNFAKSNNIAASLELSARRTIDHLNRMAEVFLPRDELLSSAGIVPVYYWIIRNMNDTGLTFARESLLKFEYARKSHREKQFKNPNSAYLHTKYARVDTFNRSTNDVGSHRGRYEILKSEIQSYAEEQDLNDPFL